MQVPFYHIYSHPITMHAHLYQVEVCMACACMVEVQKVKGQSHEVIRCTADVGLQVYNTA